MKADMPKSADAPDFCRILSSRTPRLYSLTSSSRRPSGSTPVALAENPPGTMPPASRW